MKLSKLFFVLFAIFASSFSNLHSQTLIPANISKGAIKTPGPIYEYEEVPDIMVGVADWIYPIKNQNFRGFLTYSITAFPKYAVIDNAKFEVEFEENQSDFGDLKIVILSHSINSWNSFENKVKYDNIKNGSAELAKYTIIGSEEKITINCDNITGLGNLYTCAANNNGFVIGLIQDPEQIEYPILTWTRINIKSVKHSIDYAEQPTAFLPSGAITTLSPTLTWDGSLDGLENCFYKVIISSTSDFNNVIYKSNGMKDNELIVPSGILEKDKTYYWYTYVYSNQHTWIYNDKPMDNNYNSITTPDNSISITPSYKLVSALSGNTSYSVSSNDSWTVSDDASWITSISPSSGSGNETIKVYYSANSSSEARTGNITVSNSDGKTSSAALKQNPPKIDGGIDVWWPDGDVIYQIGEYMYIHWESSINENVKIAVLKDGNHVQYVTYSTSNDGGKQWFVPTSFKSAEKYSFKITSVDNDNIYGYSAVFAIQDNYLTSNPSSIVSDYHSQTKTLSLQTNSNVGWDVVRKPDWIQLNPTMGNGTNNIEVSFNENNSVSSRADVLKIKTNNLDDNIELEVILNQSGIPQILESSVDTIYFDYKGSQQKFNITSNLDWQISNSISWIHVSPSSGSGNHEIVVNLDSNETFENRIDKVNLSGNSISKDIVIVQLPTPKILQVEKNIYSVSYEAGEINVELLSNLAWTIESSHIWLTCNPLSGSLNKSLNIKFEENGDDSTRIGYLTIVSGTNQTIVSISQDGSSGTGDLEITVKNINGSSTPYPGDNGSVKLYSGSNNIDTKSTNSSGTVTFNNLDSGDYWFEVFHDGGTLFGDEFWGKSASISIDADKSVQFLRYMPYTTLLKVYNGENDITGETVKINTPLVIKIKIQNDGEDDVTAYSRLLLDIDRVSPFDSDENSPNKTIQKNNSMEFQFNYTPVTKGNYYGIPGTYSSYKNNLIATDGWDWSNSSPLFVVDETNDIVENNLVPEESFLSQNFPNPFNPSTIISYAIQENSFVQIIVYDILGVEVATLVNETKNAGFYDVSFDATNLSNGIYFYKIQAGNFVDVKKMILLK